MKPEWSEKIFDSFLEEAATGRHPPDLLERIQVAWQRERAGQIPLPTGAQAEQELVPPPIVAKVTRKPKPLSKLLPPLSTRHVSHTWPVLLVVAASGILIACVIQWRAILEQSENVIAHRTTLENNRFGSSLSKLPQPSQSKSIVTGETNSANKSKGEIEREELALNSVPFANRGSVNSPAVQRSVDRSVPVNRLSEHQIVELIDSQLAVLWRQLKIVPAERLNDIQLAQSVSKVLTGQELPSAAAGELAEPKPHLRLDKVLAAGLDSQAFARRWGEALVQGWVRGGALSRESVALRPLEEFVAGGIAHNRPWNEVVEQVIAGDSPAGNVLVASFAGDGNHRLAVRLSSTFLDSSLGCVRCHEPKGLAASGLSQDQYWSLVAMLMGLDSRRADKETEPKAVDNQAELFVETKQPNLYFDRPDGTLEAAKFVLPDGRPWQSVVGAKTPRAALANWIGNSSRADEAIVNQVWHVALGRPLVAVNLLMDDTGLAERIELQRLLALQFRAYGGDLKRLIGWVVRSDAFARDAITVDRNRWLQASESELENWHLAEMTFAARSSLGGQAVRDGLESSLAAIVKWNRSKPTEGETPVLAQPQAATKLNTKTAVASEEVMPAPAYAIHRGRLSKDQQAFVNSLVASNKLSWEQKVDHVVCLSPSLRVSSDVRRLSEELLKSLGDRKAVLIELLWAVQNADAG